MSCTCVDSQLTTRKGCPVSDGQEFSEEFGITYHKSREVKEITDEILKYTGKDKNPRWRSMEPGTSIHTHADMSS